jgi:secreted protein with Ig-like and vWFA domain
MARVWGAASYEIISITPQVGLTAAVGNATTGAGQVAAAIVNDVFTNVTSGSLTVVYNVRPFAGGCFGDAINVTLTVSPEPVMNASLNATVCSDAVSGITLNTSGTSAAASSYDIISITPQIGLVAAVGNATTGVGQAASAIV